MKTLKAQLFIGRLKPISNVLLLVFTSISLSACNTLIGGTGLPGVPAGGPSLPTPPISGGTSGGAGESSPPSLPSKPSSGQSSDSEDGAEQKEAKSSEGEGGESPDAEVADGWEDQSDDTEQSTNDGQPSFEEPEDDEFKAPSFEDKGGLSEQELADLEKELDETLGDFDEEIKREQEYAEANANGTQNNDVEDAFEEYSEEAEKQVKAKRKSTSTAKQSSSEDAANSDSDSESQESGESSQSAEENKQETSKQEQNPNTVPDDGADVEDLRKNDDIVARQIREAAENEVDPELKKKLWQEYYNYKQQ